MDVKGKNKELEQKRKDVEEEKLRRRLQSLFKNTPTMVKPPGVSAESTSRTNAKHDVKSASVTPKSKKLQTDNQKKKKSLNENKKLSNGSSVTTNGNAPQSTVKKEKKKSPKSSKKVCSNKPQTEVSKKSQGNKKNIVAPKTAKKSKQENMKHSQQKVPTENPTKKKKRKLEGPEDFLAAKKLKIKKVLNTVAKNSTAQLDHKEYDRHSNDGTYDSNDSDYSEHDRSPSSQVTSGFVRGGDYDNHYSSDDDYDFNEYADIQEGSSNEEFTDEYDDDYCSEEENYSDFDEDDYEEEDDSFDYSDDNSYSNYDSESDDEDYQLPDGEFEDLIIHRGTAEKRNLLKSDNVTFDDDREDAQVIEIPEESPVKTVQQPKEYQRGELEKLTANETQLQSFLEKQKLSAPEDEVASNGTECPQLVPIIDEDGFQLYNGELDSDSEDSLDSVYEECSDQDGSFMSEDVNSKYTMNGLHDEFSDDEEMNGKPSQMTAEVIEVENVEFVDLKTSSNTNIETMPEADMLPSQILSTDLNTKLKGNVISRNIITKSKEMSPIHEVDNNQETPQVNEIPSVAATSSQDYDTPKNKDRREIASNSQTHTEPETPIKPTPEIDCESSPEAQTFTANNISHNDKAHATNRSIFCNSIDTNHVLVLVRDPLYIYGTVKVILIAGSIEIYGRTPKIGDEFEIFSPRGLSSVEINTRQNTETTKEEVSQEMQRIETYFSKPDLQKVLDNYSLQHDALILLTRNERRKKIINTFKKYMSENIFPNMNSIQMERTNYSSEFLLRCIINTESDKPLKINPKWAQLQLRSNSRVMLIGGKSVGKSTLLRYLVNRHLTDHPRILVIDLDIGQPELFVPQTISATPVSQPLIGPGFFLNLQPAKSFVIGHSNIVLCPHRYMRAVNKLLRFCSEQPEYAQIPWLINTMGYNKGFGSELVAVICEYLHPTDVVQLQSNKEINNFDHIMEPHIMAALPRNIFIGEEFNASPEERAGAYSHQLHVFNSAVMQQSRYQKEWDMSAKDMRYAILLARLSEALIGNAEWLTDVQPISASLNDLKVVNMLSGDYTRDQLLKCIEANLVYICQMDDEETIPTCLGIGVVRGIDYHVNQLYMIPALPHTQLRRANCLAIGEMPLSTSIFTNQGPKVKNTAPFVYNTLDANASKSIKQIYHRPAEFLTGKHKNTL